MMPNTALFPNGKRGPLADSSSYQQAPCAVLAIKPAAGANIPDTTWTYKSVNEKDLQMSVFLPGGYEQGTRFPTFVVFHGGSWTGGEASWHYADCAYWRSRGMVAVSVDYRLKERDKVEVPLACVKDAKSAIRFLRTNATALKIDTDKIVVAGASAGGQLAAATAMIDAPTTNDDQDDLAISSRPNAVILCNPYFRCRKDLSPPNFITKELPPMITFLGDQDRAIKVDDLLAFHEALRKEGNASEYYVGKGGKHGFCNGRDPRNRFFYWSVLLEDRFLVKHGILKGELTLKVPNGVATLSEKDYDAYK